MSISAEVDKTAIALNDQVRLVVVVRSASASLPDPELPSLANFSVYSSGRSQNISISNGRIESAVTYEYALVPRFVGKAVIGPITVQDSGQKAVTAPIEIQVVRPSGQGTSPAPVKPQAGEAGVPERRTEETSRAPDLFVEASLDKRRAFVNEQITLGIRFYTAVSLMGNPEYVAPNTGGFFSEDLPPLRTYQKNLHGRTYYVTEIKTALFAAAAGRHTISPAVIRAQVQESQTIDPFASDFFERFFRQGGLGSKGVEVRTDPLTVIIDPLPEEGQPKDFTGTVGRYSLSSILGRSELKVGEALDLVLIVEGEGNLKTVFAPKLPEMQAFRVYDTLSSLNLKKDGDIVRGSKTFKTVLVPRASGTRSLPVLEFHFFDPKTRSYQTRTVGPMTLKVKAAEATAATTFPSQGPAPGPVAVEYDIHHILSAPLQKPWTRLLAAAGRAGTSHALPVLFWAVCLGIFAVRAWRARIDPKAARFMKAPAAARHRLRKAQALQDDPAQVHTILGDALSHFLADRLGLSANGLTLRQALSALKSAAPGVQPGRLDEVQSLWDEIDALRYAPGGRTRKALGDLAKRLETLLATLEKETQK